MKASEVTEVIKQRVEELKLISERRITATTDKDHYRDVLHDLRGRDIQHLVTISGVDLGKEIAVVYHIDCGGGALLNLKLNLDKRAPILHTVTDIFPGAILYERDLMEMLGVKVENHPDPRRLFLPDDWPPENYPLRKEVKK